MNRKALVAVLVVLVAVVAAPLWAAMTNSASRITTDAQYITSNNRTLNPVYKFANEAEGYLEGTTAFPYLTMTSTDTEPGTTEGMVYYDTSEHMLKVRTNSAYVALGSGTFSGGNITSDCTMSDGVDLNISTAVSDGNCAITVYDVDNTTLRDVLRWTNANTPTIVLGAAANQFSLASTAFNVSSAGALSGITTIAMGGALTGVTTITASGIGTFDSLALANAGTIANSTDTEITFAENSEDLGIDFQSNAVALTSSTGVVAWDFGDVDALSGINTVAFDAAASTVTLTSDSGGDDLTIGVAGATDSSLVLSSTGTGADALQITTTAGGIDITSAGTAGEDIDILASAGSINITARENAADAIVIGTSGGGGTTEAINIANDQGTGEAAVNIDATAGGVDIDAAAGKDLALTGGQVVIASADNAASAISLTANVGASETIVVTNTQGTSEAAITLASTAGGIDADAAAGKDINLGGGQIALVSKDNAASAISLTANSGASETIVVTNTQGTGEAAITLTSTAGGIDADAAAGKDVNIAGGQVALVSKDNAASAISLTANVGASETITVTNTQGTGAGAITLTATAGGITMSSSAGLATGDPITGDGTAALGGFLKTVTNDVDNEVLTVAGSGKVYTNAGDSDAQTYTLPAAAAGLEFTFIVMVAQELRVDPAAGDVIYINGTGADAGEYWTANAVGEVLHLIAVDDTNWIAVSYGGTWTQETP